MMTEQKTSRPSLALVSGLEVISVLSSVLIVTWGIAPLLPRNRWLMSAPLFLALILTTASHWVRRESLAQIGLTFRYFWEAVRLLSLPMMIGAALLIFTGWISGTISAHFGLLSSLPALLLSGIAQQYLLQGFIHRRIIVTTAGICRRFPAAHSPLSTLMTAACFSIVHVPNPSLTFLTFVGGLLWSVVYQRAPNIYAIGLSHGMMSLLVVNTLPPSVLHSLSVGYKHFLYQNYL